MARKIRAIFWIGLTAGTLDITENLVFNHFRGISPWRVFQYIDSGLIGLKSFQSGWSSVTLGVPLSGVPHPPAAITIASRVNAVLALIFCIGLPISLLTRAA